MSYAIHGVIGGPYMAMFALGMFVPWSNSVVRYVSFCFSLLGAKSMAHSTPGSQTIKRSSFRV